MAITSLDGRRFAEMIIQGANHLSVNAQMVDALNVFPVPDGDTGTNMNLSMSSGAKEVQQNTQPHIGYVGKALAKGLLMGARGNSGVILSQLFRGFSKAIEDKDSITSKEFAAGLEAGVDTAYRAVMKPVEGTILTVAKDAAKKAVQIAKNQPDFVVVMEEVLKEANRSLKRTPDLLPVLKEVGVVDSGGQGLVCVYEGFLASLKGEASPENSTIIPSMKELVNAEHHKGAHHFMDPEDIEFGYCTEFMVKLEAEKLKKHPFTEELFTKEISAFGDSLLVITDEELVKVHIHAEHPGDVLSYGQRYGSLINMKIENMREQHRSILNSSQLLTEKTVHSKKQTYGIVVVSMGSGIGELFKSIGATAVIEGGQSMNPSTEDIVNAIEQVNAENIIILPNNKNIIMAAKQAADIVKEKTIVIESKTVPQGLAALLSFNPTANLEDNYEVMSDALQHVKTGQITYAVRDTNIDGLEIAKGDFMGIADGKIVDVNKDKVAAATALLEQMVDEDTEIITIIYGEDVSPQELTKLENDLQMIFPDIEMEIHHGNQPLYAFIFSVE